MKNRERTDNDEHSRECRRPGESSVYIEGICHITRQTQNVTLPSLKKYLPCCRKESSLFWREPSLSPDPILGKLAGLASGPVRRAVETPGVNSDFTDGSGSNDSFGTAEAAHTLDTTGY